MELSLEFFATVGHLMTGFGTLFAVVLLFRTLKHLEASTRVAIIQTEFKFRPWVGPTGVIREANSNQEKKQFDIIIKNFGDLPASNVTVYSIVKSSKISRDDIRAETATKVDLGPVLPNMEKRFWLDIANEIIDGARQTNSSVWSGVVFEYPLPFGKSEYGLISEIDPETFLFVHKDMWVKSPPIGRS